MKIQLGSRNLNGKRSLSQVIVKYYPERNNLKEGEIKSQTAAVTQNYESLLELDSTIQKHQENAVTFVIRM